VGVRRNLRAVVPADREGDGFGVLMDGDAWSVAFVVLGGVRVVAVVGNMKTLLRRLALG
jgi:hypothetical protein